MKWLGRRVLRRAVGKTQEEGLRPGEGAEVQQQGGKRQIPRISTYTQSNLAAAAERARTLTKLLEPRMFLRPFDRVTNLFCCSRKVEQFCVFTFPWSDLHVTLHCIVF